MLQHDLILILEQKEYNDMVLKVGLGWQSSIQDDKIRSSTDIKDEVTMPVDYDKLVARNSPDVEVRRQAAWVVLCCELAGSG